jgi:histidine triad (HIT) family protein
VNGPTGDCPFCAIVAGEAEAQLVYESPDLVAFFPKQPAALGHTLVVPSAHVPDLWALPPAEAPALTAGALHVGAGIRHALRPDGMNVIVSAGAAASQTVDHLHVHLVPRWDGDAFGDIWPRPSPAFPDPDLEAAAHSIRTALG